MDRKLYWIGAFIILAMMFITTMAFVQNKDNQSAKQPQKVEQTPSPKTPSRVDEIIFDAKSKQAETERVKNVINDVEKLTGIICRGLWYYDEACGNFLKKLAREDNADIVTALSKIKDAKVRIIISSHDSGVQTAWVSKEGTLVISTKSDLNDLRKYLGLK